MKDLHNLFDALGHQCVFVGMAVASQRNRCLRGLLSALADGDADVQLSYLDRHRQ